MRSHSLMVLAFLVSVAGADTVRAQSPPVLGSWAVVASPNGGTGVEGNLLLATVAISSTDVWAVGAAPNRSSFLTATLAEHWDGTEWSIVETPPIDLPFVRLNSIAAVGSRDVWAAGYAENPSCICAETVIEHWDGSSWIRVSSPNPGVANFLYGITAVSPTDIWAVGYQWPTQSLWVPLLLHYDGTSWTQFDQSQLEYARLSSVFALASNDVWAVGWIGRGAGIEALALHWDGTSWTSMPFPTEPGGWIGLNSVSGVAANDAWAVGTYSYYNINGQVERRARSYHWDGVSWTNVVVGLGGYSYLTNVAANATDDVWAVGAGYVGYDPTYRYVTLHWDGISWSNVGNPNQGILYAVSASSRWDVWAVGYDFATTRGTHSIHYTEP